MALVAVLSMTIGLLLGSFLTFHLLVSYDEVEGEDEYEYDYDDIESALPSKEVRNDTAVVSEHRNLVGNTDEIRAILAKRRQGGRR